MHWRKEMAEDMKRKKIKYGHGKVDRAFFEARGFKVIQHEPWAWGFFHDNLSGKFLWYPGRGTLMYQTNPKSGKKVGEFFTNEEVYEQIQRKINESLPEGW